MTVKCIVQDPHSKLIAEVVNHGEQNALVVATRDLKTYENKISFFVNPTYGVDMNQAVVFSGTPDRIYNGGDETLWTASVVSGPAARFDLVSTTHAKGGTCTVLIAANLAGATVTVNGTNITNTTLTEGVDWTKTDGDNAATATSLASAINGVTGVSSSASSNIVTVTADTGADLTTLTTSAAGADMTATQQCIDAILSTNDDTVQLAKGSDVTLSNYTTLTGWIYITAWPGEFQNVRITPWDTDTGTSVGNSVDLGDFINEGEFNVWQEFAISLETLGIANATTVDAFRITTIDTGAGNPPDYYLDNIQIEEVGSSFEYTVKPAVKTWFHVEKFRIFFADAFDSTVANGTSPGIPYDSILGVSELPIGLLYQRIAKEEIKTAITFKNTSDLLEIPGGKLSDVGCDGTNTWMALDVEFAHPLTLKAEEKAYLSLTINDDLSGLLKMRAAAVGREESRS